MSSGALTIGFVVIATLAVGALVAAALTRAYANRVARIVDHVEQHDQLTGLPNRTAGTRAIERQLLARRPFGLILIDLDRFAAVNDTYGQELGDQLFSAFATRVRNGLRPEEELVRWGGPQLMLVAPDLGEDASQVERRAAEVGGLVDARVQLGHDTLRITATVGAAAIGASITSVDDAVEAAQAALRSARAAKVGPSTSGPPRSPASRHERPAVRGDSGGARERVRQALDNDEFWLLFSPVAHIETRAIAGVQAILHWSDPRRGVLHIDEVRAELARSGMEAEVAWVVLDQAVEQLARWSVDHPELELVVNVSVPNSLLTSEGAVERIDQVLAGHGAAGSQLCLEVCGQDRFDLDRTDTILRRLQVNGVLLGLESFGTSWSSLSYLRRSAPEVLKVPERFVSGLGTSREDEAIVQQVVGLARSLGIAPIAEGVSHPAQLEVLRSIGCDLAQGPLIGAPQPVEVLESHLKRGRVDLTPA